MQPRSAGAKDGQASHQHDTRLRARPVDDRHARQLRLKALAEEARKEPPDQAVLKMHLHHVRGVAAVGQDRRTECDRPNGRIAPPVAETLTALARPNPQIVEGIVPTRVFRERWIVGIEPVGFHFADRRPTGVIENIARARQRGRSHTMQIFWINTDALTRTFEGALQIGLLLQQPFVTGAFVVVHFGARAIEPFGVAFLSDGPSDRRPLAAQNAAFGQTLRDAVLDHLADRSELFADGLRLPDQRLQHDVGFTLLVAEVSTNDLFRRLKLTIDAAVALLQPGGVPRQIEMNKVGAVALEVDALAGRVSADEDAQRLNIRDQR